jgi:PAS domain S-box-containing protein
MILMLEFQLGELLEGTADAAFAVDIRGEVRTWNRSAERLFGYNAPNAIGKQCSELICGQIADGITVCCESCDLLNCVRAGKEVSNYDMEITTSSGQQVWVNVSLLVVHNQRTERRLIVHFMRDIRERKKVELQMAKILKLARELASRTQETISLPPIVSLTAQECNALRLISTGKTGKEVSEELNISVSTLRNHMYHINQKLHTSSRTEAVVQALKRGLI